MRLSIVIPAYNEGAGIEQVARGLHQELQKAESDFEVVIVDNGSTDDTKTILEKLHLEIPRIRPHSVFPNRGYGGGILAGLDVARGEVIGWTDGDGQIDPEVTGEMYKKMVQEGIVFIKAKRTVRHDGFFRAVQSHIFNSIFKVMFLTSVSDVNAKPKLFRRSFYESIDLVSTDLFIDAEIVIKALRRGVRISDYPITFQSRESGSSKIRVGAGFEFIKNLIRYRIFG